jgi:hypothetical protein
VLGRRSTEPKVRGSNPLGRVLEGPPNGGLFSCPARYRRDDRLAIAGTRTTALYHEHGYHAVSGYWPRAVVEAVDDHR